MLIKSIHDRPANNSCNPCESTEHCNVINQNHDVTRSNQPLVSQIKINPLVELFKLSTAFLSYSKSKTVSNTATAVNVNARSLKTFPLVQGRPH